MSGIKQQLASGVFYTAIAKYTGIVISIVITGVLSRLLTPSDFGTIVPITVLVTFFTILGDVGIGPAVIQNNRLTDADVASIFSFTLFTGGGLALLFFLSSWGIAAFYDSEIVVVLCQILSVSLFFACANVVPNALLYKAKKFRYLAVRSLAVQLLAGSIAILSAWFGAGLYALVIQSVLSSIFLFIISYRARPLPLRLRQFDWEPLKKIRSFSSYQFLFNVFNYFSVNLDKLLINKFMGPAPLGYYDKSYKLMQMPLQNIPYIITPVMHPIFCQMQDDLQKMSFYYNRIVRFLAFVGFPLSILLFFTGHELIYIIFGPQWEASVPVFRILALSVGFQIVLSTSGSIFQSSGSTHLLLLSGVLSTVAIVTAVLTGLFVFGTLEAVGGLLLGAFVVNFFQAFSIMYCILFKTGMMPFLKQIASPLVLSAIVGGLLFLLSPFAVLTGEIPSLMLKGATTVCVVFLYIQFTGEYDLLRKTGEYLTRLRRK